MAAANQPRTERARTGQGRAERQRTERIQHPDTASLDLATIMRTLGDPIRLDIVRLLADDQPRLCSEIAELVGLPDSTNSYHLRLLREAGLTRARAEGTRRYVSLRRDDLEARFPGLADVITRRDGL